MFPNAANFSRADRVMGAYFLEEDARLIANMRAQAAAEQAAAEKSAEAQQHVAAGAGQLAMAHA